MPLLIPKQGENKENFFKRFMGSEKMKAEFPDNDQRIAVAYSQWRAKHRK